MWAYRDGDPVLERLPTLKYNVVFAYGVQSGEVWYTSFHLSETGLVQITFRNPSPPVESWDDPTAPGWILPRAE